MKNLSLDLGMQPSIIGSLGSMKLVDSHSLQHINSRYPIGMSLHLSKVGNMVNKQLENLSQK